MILIEKRPKTLIKHREPIVLIRELAVVCTTLTHNAPRLRYGKNLRRHGISTLLMFRFYSEGNSSKFEEIVAYQGVLCEKVGEEEYRLNSVFS